MSEIIEFQTGDGLVFAVEVAETEDHVYRKVSTEPDDDSPRSFSRALERIRPVANELAEKLKGLSYRPDEVEVEFGIKLSGKVGALIASTGTEANFKIRLTWSAPADEERGTTQTPAAGVRGR